MRRLVGGVTIAVGSGLLMAGLLAQGREWTTSNGDAQRTSWVRTDVRLTRDAVQKGELKFLWKMKLPNETRQLQSLTQPILLDRLISHRGFKALAFVGASSERVYAIDTDLARLYWETVLNYSSITPPGNSTATCPGGLVAAVSRPTDPAPAAFTAGGGRGGRSGSSVGEPGQGAPSLQPALGRGRGTGDPAVAGRGAQPPAPPPAPTGRRTRPPLTGIAALGGGPTENVYVLASDGFVRALNAHNGTERQPAVHFLPANAHASALLFVHGMLYTTTSNECGAVPNGVYAVDLESDTPKTISWHTGGPNVAGSAGPTLGTDGTIYVALREHPSAPRISKPAQKHERSYASSIVALDGETLSVKDWFTAPGADFNASPVVFRYTDTELVVATANDGRLYVLDSRSLGGADHKTPLHVTAAYSSAGAAAGVATWEDRGTRWILAPGRWPTKTGRAASTPATAAGSNGGVVAFRIAEREGQVTLEKAWTSRAMTTPLTPVIFNGVAFVVSSGEYVPPPDANSSAAQRAQRSVPAVLYALDPATGTELWNSGKTIASFARAGISAAAGQVYVVTFDNTLHAFGIPMEH